ncbi:MAG: NADP-specific glutamate dehydrogenase [Chitinophagaceae bacterium]|nr:NADP-specific glutamate dehydrogenase [Chitinophagaceae bacterium]MBL0131873.1 NADP-specific glutamate dehydrogenase [Chitinophagaceae bacterium]MBL0274346.1 NADP-specific glutamate dehydrogenase [Chitinophagaceae bacterium]
MNQPAIDDFMQMVVKRNPAQLEFHQAVYEVAMNIIPFIEEHPEYKKANILERMIEAERILIFRVPWMDDAGNYRVNRGYRVQMNNAIGPYKGGLRFHPNVTLSVLKFLAFEQVFKNSLTTLPMGGGKGGSDFDPKGKSDNEVMRFCQSFMTELFRHIGKDTDIPAGDIGVGSREIGYLFGQFKRLTNEFTGVLTGKGYAYGGSLIRPEATGYGLLFFVEEMLKTKGQSIKNKKVVISGSGNVAQYAIEKTLAFGGIPLTASDSNGFVYDPDGIDTDKLAFLMELKNKRRGRISEYADEYGCPYYAGEKPWKIPCDVALPCAVQNELNETDAQLLIKNGCKLVAEGANMPTTPEAISLLQKNEILYAPGKASNAGGVAASGLEMSQNSIRLYWTREEVENRLKVIMHNIHEQCIQYGKKADGTTDYLKGANIAGFVRVADAMLAEGHV